MESALKISSYLESPHFDERKEGEIPQIILLHYTGMETLEKTKAWLCSEQSRVSCHYLIDEEGGIIQMVREDKRAWHAGVSFWHGATDLNSRSFGIELQNPGHAFGYTVFPQKQISSTIALCLDLMQRYAIARTNVLAHSDVAPARKQDPGELFPWEVLWKAGVGHWVFPSPAENDKGWTLGENGPLVLDFQKALAHYGYDCPQNGVYDFRTQFVVTAFQRHFRPVLVSGLADLSTRKTLQTLLETIPD